MKYTFSFLSIGPNAAAIVGGVFGGLSVVLIIAVVIIVIVLCVVGTKVSYP